MNARWVVGTFDNETDVVRAARSLRDRGFKIDDVYTPYPVHALTEVMGLRPSRLTWVCFLAGAVGLALAMWFQYWTSAVDWPINIGGKPYNSWPAFIPIAFEITVLFAGLGVVLALLIRARLGPGSPSLPPTPRVTDDHFVVVARIAGAQHTAVDAQALLREHGALEVEDHVEGQER